MQRDETISELMAVFMQFKRHMRRQMNTGQHDGLTVTQVELLFGIDKGCKRLSDLAENQQVTPSAATQQLKYLEALDLISRQEGADRRESNLSLTTKGQKYLANRRQIFQQHFTQLLSALSDKEIQEFTKIMRKMIVQTPEQK